jgi:hypothetical protein
MFETVREAIKIINNIQGEREVFYIDLFICLQEAYWHNDFHALW